MNERNYLKFPYTKTRAMSQQTNAWNEWIVLTTQSFWIYSRDVIISTSNWTNVSHEFTLNARTKTSCLNICWNIVSGDTKLSRHSSGARCPNMYLYTTCADAAHLQNMSIDKDSNSEWTF